MREAFRKLSWITVPGLCLCNFLSHFRSKFILRNPIWIITFVVWVIFYGELILEFNGLKCSLPVFPTLGGKLKLYLF